MRFIYGIKVHDELQTDEMKRPRRFEHFDDAARAAAVSGAASHKGRFREALAKYTRPGVLVDDDVGHLTYGSDAANVLFHVVNERYIKRRPIVFTTTNNPKAWAPVLHDDHLADVIVDRVLDRGRHLKLDRSSFRANNHLDLDTAPAGDRGSARPTGTPQRSFRNRHAQGYARPRST